MLYGKNYRFQARKEELKSRLLIRLARPNSRVENMNSPDIKPNIPNVKLSPITMSL
jgi:hypothetical protein